jgi:hypothetical protein
MPELKTYLEHIDSSVIVWRKGTSEDPYIPRSDSLPVINNRITLLEVPSYTHKVQITGFVEVPEEVYKKTKALKENEFVVNYAVGIIQFHPSQEGNTLVCSYLGRGLILYPASRIYAIARNNPDVLVTLQDYVDQLVNYTKTINEKIIEINKAISDAIDAINNANVATDNANEAADHANQAAQAAYDAAATTVVIRKPAVDTYDDLETVYPEPENGWQVLINTTGDIYRYDGVVSHQWQLVGNIIGEAIPYVSENSDGLLHKEDYQNFILRRVLFKIPQIFKQGVQITTGFSQIPFDGEIIEVKADCVETGIGINTLIGIEKISKDDFPNGTWDNIFSENLSFEIGSTTATGGIIVEDFHVSKGDYFRINVYQFDNNIKGITVSMDIKTKYHIT